MWWTLRRQYGADVNVDTGIKLGPLTISTYVWDGRREWGVFALGCGIDTVVIRRGGQWIIR